MPTSTASLLWVDDEMELLRAHILFLKNKGYDVATVTNGSDAIEQCRQHTFDLILLDEMMPGLSGLETLQRIKDIQPATPVVMVTKSEEENIMDQAIGSKIADYLIKPVNPSQILLTLKKNIHQRDIVAEVTTTNYRQEFQMLSMQIVDSHTIDDWKAIYRRLVRWELDLNSADSALSELLTQQKKEANSEFARYIRKNYIQWIQARSAATARPEMAGQVPLLSPDIFKTNVFPLLSKGEKIFLIVVDNLRYDQWVTISSELREGFDIDEQLYLSILPTATQYARNAIFSGLMPLQIAEMYPNLWVDEDEEEGKNLNEEPLIRTQLERFRRKHTFSYHKINDSQRAEQLIGQLPHLERNDLNVVVVNFIDMLSHARTESRMVRELANNESAYRSITLSWFRHSVIADLLKTLSSSPYKVMITTDHGSIRTDRPVKIVGDRNTNTNLRYKLGKNLSFNDKDLFVLREPKQAQLPTPNISTSYVFATGDDFFAYPNNYNYYVSYYKNTFQHGGISMEEMLIPLITLTPRQRN